MLALYDSSLVYLLLFQIYRYEVLFLLLPRISQFFITVTWKGLRFRSTVQYLRQYKNSWRNFMCKQFLSSPWPVINILTYMLNFQLTCYGTLHFLYTLRIFSKNKNAPEWRSGSGAPQIAHLRAKTRGRGATEGAIVTIHAFAQRVWSEEALSTLHAFLKTNVPLVRFWLSLGICYQIALER